MNLKRIIQTMTKPRFYLWLHEQDGFTVGGKNYAMPGEKRVKGCSWPGTQKGLKAAQCRARELQQSLEEKTLLDFEQWQQLTLTNSPNCPAVVRIWDAEAQAYVFMENVGIGYITVNPSSAQRAKSIEIIEYA